MGTKISVEWCPTTHIAKEDISYVPYSSALGIFMYYMVFHRIDISQAMRVLSQFIGNLVCEHWDVVNRVFKYLQGTLEYFIYYHSDV